MISTGTLDWLRAISAAFLPDVAEIARYTEENTAEGLIQEWQTVAADVPCRVSPGGAGGEDTGSTGSVVRSVSEWTIWLPALADVTKLDRITVTGSDRPDGRTFEVTTVRERSYESVRACICALVS